RYLTGEGDETPILRNITWHGVRPLQADFSDSSRFLAWTLEAFRSAERGDMPIYVASNVFWEPIAVELPPVEGRWYRVVDTWLPPGEDIVPEEEACFLPEMTYVVQPRSTIVLVAR